MVKSRIVLSLMVIAGLFIASAPVSAQINSSGFAFGQTFIISKVDDGRILLSVFGFFANGPGFGVIDVKCPLNDPVNLVATLCDTTLEPGFQVDGMTGLPPDTASDHPNHYVLRSITAGIPVIVSSFLPQGAPGLLDSERWPTGAWGATRPKIFGEIRSVAAA